MSENSIHLKVPKHPDEKESTFDNSFNIVNVVAVVGYLCYNFSIEWQNWDKISSSYNESWRVSVSDDIESQVMRLDEVCKNLYVTIQLFTVIVGISVLWSATRFICRQWLIFEQATSSESNCKWFSSLLFLMFLKQLQTGVTLFGMLLILPTSFFSCYSILSRYLCTVAISCFIIWFLLSVIISIISKPILNFRIPYTELGAVGRNVEVDPKEYKDKPKYEDEDVELDTV